MYNISKKTGGTDLKYLNESLKRISKTNDNQNTELEKLCRLFGISYLLNEFEIDMLNEYIKKMEKKRSRRNQIR